MEKKLVKIIISTEGKETLVREIYVENNVDLLSKVSQYITLYDFGLNYQLQIKQL